MVELIGSRQFELRDQEFFASLSGDFNPMHMDPVAARRTQAGAPVVHGIHNLLTGLNLLATRHPALPPIATLKASFTQMVYIGDTIAYHLTQLSETGAVLEALVEGGTAARLSISFGPPRPPKTPLTVEAPTVIPDAALDLTIEEMAGRSGRVGVPAQLAQIEAAFPAAAAAWSAPRLAAILGTTALVGMVCPGLHSIFGGLTLNAGEPTAAPGLAWRVSNADPRFRVVRMQVEGQGVWGTIDSFARMPPAAQAGMADVARLVARDEFAGSTALIIGGSRGLGEITAKLLAAGGAHVIITYATGQRDAEALAETINSWGGTCDTLQYDVRQPAAAQLAALPAPPTQMYYFATPMIGRRKSGIFVAARYAELQDYYVTGFYNLVAALKAASPGRLTALYPSTVFVEDRPEGMVEYAMAKMAGETLCADLTAYLPDTRVVINRLPRLPTDQNATVMQVKTEDPLTVMLPVIRDVQG